jgi:hypothetical protein
VVSRARTFAIHPRLSRAGSERDEQEQAGQACLSVRTLGADRQSVCQAVPGRRRNERV